MENNKVVYKIIDKKVENDTVFTLSLELKDGGIPEFISGQYINIYFDDLDTSEGKAYSMSSAYGENIFNLTIKLMGEFSNKLNSLDIGDEIKGTLPYGFFYSEEDADLVLIAGGIGVTPFRSMIFENNYRHKQKSESKKITLFHSVRNEADLAFADDFTRLKAEGVGYVDYIQNISSKEGRFTFNKLSLNSIEDKEFMICGSISFVRDIWRLLKNEGVRDSQIYTEAFFSH